ncbi:MAG: leucine-rich repeat protein [Clostridia bacterium]|nr:leucine-rich repeat protein [Clostridia bacterium]
MEFEIENGVLKKYNGESARVVIPQGVTKIGASAFKDCWYIENAVLPEGVTDIEEKAFSYCDNLQEILLPDSLKRIGWGAFFGCQSLWEVRLPCYIEQVEDYAFYDCENVRICAELGAKSLLSGNSIPQCCRIEWEETPRSIKYLAQEFDIENGVLKKYKGNSPIVEIPACVKEIGEGAFERCGSLIKLFFPEHVEEVYGKGLQVKLQVKPYVVKIGKRAFCACDGLQTVMFPHGLACIEKEAFAYCERLAWVVIPPEVATIETNAFLGCRNLKIYAEMGQKPFGWVKKLFGGNWNPDNCPVEWNYVRRDPSYDPDFEVEGDELKRYTSFGGGAIKIPMGVKKIADDFGEENKYTLEMVESIEFPYGLREIGVRAFENCKNLKKVILPDTVWTIGENAFYDCEQLEECNMPDWLMKVGDCAFTGTKFISNNKYWKVSEYSNGQIAVGELYLGETLVDLRGIEGEYKVKEGTQYINAAALSFHNSEMTDLILPKSLKNAHSLLLEGCKNLKSITMPNGTRYTLQEYYKAAQSEQENGGYEEKEEGIQYVGGWGFLSIAVVSGKECCFQEGTTSIGPFAVSGDQLEIIHLPDSIGTIYSTSFLETAYYEKEDNWENGVLYIGKHLISAENLTERGYAVKDGTLTVAYEAFVWARDLEEVILPDSLKRLNGKAFAGCQQLKAVYIPKSVEYVGHRAFQGCDNVTIYTEAVRQAEDWERDWNPEQRLVIWGVKREDFLK